ncbi:MAG: YicC family protein [Eubacterium sp.]|nr:YicC family protein [Eubacterium sp.]
MINSMTGFGRAELVNSDRKIVVEMKSVNHRYLDYNIKMPRRFNKMDPFIRSVLKDYMKRGKVDVFLSYEEYANASAELKYNSNLASQYVERAGQIAEEFGLANDLTVTRLMHFQDILHTEDAAADEEVLKEQMEQVLRAAGEQFQSARAREGQALLENLLEKLSRMEELVAAVVEREPMIQKEYRRKLEEKTAELLGDAGIDESRIAAEVVIFADKICTDEETVRLKSHIANMRKELKSGGSVGRKLDFLAQEMNREANTILSKANDIQTSEYAIELKTEIEKIREQIQNIE